MDFAEKRPGKNEFFLSEPSPHKELRWHSFKVVCHAVGTVQWRARRMWSWCQAPFNAIYNVLCKDNALLYFNWAVLMCVLSNQLHLILPLFISPMSSFPFYYLSTLLGSVPRINPLLWNSLAECTCMQTSANSLRVHYSNSLWCSSLC